MSEERTQAPTRQRRLQARQQGHVARSGELTAAAGLLVALILLGAVGPGLTVALRELIASPLEASGPPASPTPEQVATLVREVAKRILAPLLEVLLGTVAAMVVVHQAQVGGLWVPALLAPDPSRLIAGAGGFTARAGRGMWSLVKVVVVLAVTALVIRLRWNEILALGHVHGSRLAAAAGSVALGLGRWLAVAMLALGALDFALAWRRVEAALRQTPEQQREDLRAADGDPALRARRKRVAQEWRRDSSDILPGARLLVISQGGPAVLLAGGPPPARVTVRQVARGMAAIALRRDAQRAGIPAAEEPALARQFARGRAGGTLSPAMAQRLAEIWPGGTTEAAAPEKSTGGQG